MASPPPRVGLPRTAVRCTCRTLKPSGTTSFLMAGGASSSIHVLVNAIMSSWKSFIMSCNDGALWMTDRVFRTPKLINCDEPNDWDGAAGPGLTSISPHDNGTSAHMTLVNDLAGLGRNGTVPRGRTHILIMARWLEKDDTTCSFKMKPSSTTGNV